MGGLIMHMPGSWWLLVVCMQAELVCCICCSSPVTLDGEAEVRQVKRLSWPADQHARLCQRFLSSWPLDVSNACRNSWENH